MKIKNTFWFRHFLLCSRMANIMMSPRGWHVDNFAKSIIESEEGRFGNDQMNVYFDKADEFLADLHCSDANAVFDELEEDGVSMKRLSKLTKQEIDTYYDEYCVGKIDFSHLKD